MQTCEKCGVTFTAPPGPLEVTSTRVLCPACMARRAAEKRLKASGERLAGPGATRPPAASAPANPSNSKPTPAAPVVARGNPHAATTARSAKLQPQHARAPEKPVARRKKAEAHHHLSPVFQEDAERLRKRANLTMLHGFLVVLVLSLVAGGVVWRVMSIKNAETAAEKERIDKENRVYSSLTGFNIDDEEEAKKLVAFAEDEANLKVWKGSDRASEIQGRLARAKTIIQGFHDRREVTGRFDELAAKVQEIASLTSDDLAQLKRDLETLDARAGIVSTEFVQKLADTIQAVGEAYSTRLIEEAREAAKDTATPEAARAALAKYARAEEESQKGLDAAYKAWQADRQNPQIIEKKNSAEDAYKEVIRESDELGAKVYTEDFIERTPWIDLLSGEWATKWNAAVLKGFSHPLENGVLQVVGPDPDAKGDGVISIGDLDKWRDFVLEMEITLISGGCDLFLRLGRSIDNVENTRLSSEGDGALPANEPLTVEVVFQGSEWTFYAHSESFDPGGPTSFEVSWTAQREGAIGLGVPSGTRFNVTKLRVKVLR